ncbi:MAG: hypothetical protein AMJ79_07410 [Phycisphaerae bacterium SM23_30]|nr:MAG: hypothetical protein AMJ79_07410 [Phycisphaerae bacterium SM23_30]
MQEFICIMVSLGILVVLLRLRVKLGRAMVLASVALAALLAVTPQMLWSRLAEEWHDKELHETTGYLLVSLTALLLLVNVLGKAMQETGVSQKLLPALQGLFKSRRFALALIPLMMGMLPTPGGIMLSAPMVRDAGERMGLSRSRLAAINFHFRHQWEPVWPLFPAIQFTQTLFGISAFTLISYNLILPLAGVLGGTAGLLLFGVPPKNRDEQSKDRHFGVHLKDFAHGFWPIVLAAALYVGLTWPPAVGIFISIFGFLVVHKVPLNKWGDIFRAAAEPDKALLILGALMFGVILRAADAIGAVVQFFTASGISPYILIFILPLFVGIATGMNLVTAMITFPFLLAYIGAGSEIKMGLEVLAYSGLVCGVLLTPVHLCLALSASYFEAPLLKIIIKMLVPVTFIAGAGILMAIFFR